MSSKGFPQLRQLYTTLGHPEAVMLHRDEASPHNYNQAARTAFYGWLNTHFRLGQPMPIQERDYKVLTKAELSVWDKSHPAPLAASLDFERRLLRWFADDSAAQFQQATPVARTALLRNYVEAVLGAAVRPSDVQASTETPQKLSAHMETRGTLTHATRGESVHFTALQPAKSNDRTVLWLRDDGQAALRTADGKVRTHFLALLEQGFTVLAPDLYLQGGTKVSRTRRVKETRTVPAYTFGYNDALVAQRAHDVELLTIYARQTFRGQLAVVSTGDASISAVLAGYHQAPDAAFFATAGFRFAQLKDVHDLQFLPGGAKYGDLPGLIDGLPMAASVVRWTDDPKAADEDALAWLKTAFTPRR
jgi:hypothetical protein